MKSYLITVCFLIGCFLFPKHSHGQACAAQSTVYTENFGSGDNSIPLSNGASAFSFQSVGLSAGKYKLNRKSNATTGWHTTTDHTGNYKGRMMLADASSGLEAIFTDTITQLTSNSMYTISFAVMNGSNASSFAIKVQLQAEYLNASGQFVLLGNYNSEFLPITSNPSWNVVGGYFTLPSGVSTLRYTLKNIAGSGTGNFIAVDDIQLVQCASSAASLLPTVLQSFEGSLHNDHAWLQWTTADETGLQEFQIEKSTDYKNWKTVKTMSPNTSKIIGSAYSWEEPTVIEPTQYYRLRMIHMDGLITYSSIVVLKNTNTQNMAVRVKNPITQQLELTCISQLNTTAQIRLRSLQGKIIFQQVVPIIPGSNAIKQPLFDSLAAGVYIIDMMTPQGFRFTDKLIKN